MHLEFTPEQQRLRQEIRAYYRELFTPALRAALDAEWEEMGGPVFREVVGRMGKDGWLGIGWPREYGGQGRTPLEQFIFWDETYRARAPLPVIAVNTIGPAIMEFGSASQKYLRVLLGVPVALVWCHGSNFQTAASTVSAKVTTAPERMFI